jgi:fused signal recognition particle receptor
MISWLDKLKNGLKKTSSKISDDVHTIFIKKKLSQETLDLLEETLIMADIGAKNAANIIADIKKDKFNKEVTEGEIKEYLAQKIASMLEPYAKSLITNNDDVTKVIMICGVNGNGKTTTIGKLAHFFHMHGKSVLIAACDTFRAAAIEQLEIWAKRANCPILKREENADPASVAYQAYEIGLNEQRDFVIIDTAGRLQNKTNLMEELAKIPRVLKKIDKTAPHQVILVLDATTGQNAFSQLELFSKFVQVTGLIITKLDGTAKAGGVVGLATQFKIPIFAIGVGEAIDDLKPFDPLDFAKSMVGL